MQRAALETFNIVLQVLCKTAGCQTQVLQLSHQSPGKNPFCIEKEKNTSKQESWAEPAQPQQCPCHYTTDWSCATNSLAQAVLPFHKAFHSKKKGAVQWSLPLHRERNNQKTAPTQLPFNRKHRGFWPPWLLWRPSPSGHTCPAFLSYSVCHTRLETNKLPHQENCWQVTF